MRARGPAVLGDGGGSSVALGGDAISVDAHIDPLKTERHERGVENLKYGCGH